MRITNTIGYLAVFILGAWFLLATPPLPQRADAVQSSVLVVQDQGLQVAANLWNEAKTCRTTV